MNKITPETQYINNIIGLKVVSVKEDKDFLYIGFNNGQSLRIPNGDIDVGWSLPKLEAGEIEELKWSKVIYGSGNKRLDG